MIIRRLFKAFIHVRDRVRTRIDTLLARAYATLAGAQLAPGVSFHGLPHIRVASTARLHIGARSVLRSRPASNLIGINRPCILSAHPGAVLTIGEGCGLSGTVIGCFDRITLGDNVRCGANTLITDGDWHPGDPRSSPPAPVVIGSNVWLGEGVKVLKGVTIGPDAVIGAGSIVTRDIPPGAIAAGNPCRLLRDPR